jgi:transcriptional regulator with XRE-family HTH domain
MGTRAREAPARLAEKLVQIREALDLSQDGMIRRMGVTEKITREDVSKYERGVRQPSLLVVLEYARAADVAMEVLVDDSLQLPKKLNMKSTSTTEVTRRQADECSILSLILKIALPSRESGQEFRRGPNLIAILLRSERKKLLVRMRCIN